MKENLLCTPSILQAFVDHELSEDERKNMIQHLFNCETCREQYRQLKSLSSFVTQTLFGKEDLLAEMNLDQTDRIKKEVAKSGDSEVDLDTAWLRFQAVVEKEPVPRIWKQLEQQANNGTGPTVNLQLEVTHKELMITPALENGQRGEASQAPAVKVRWYQKKLPRIAAGIALVIAGTGIFTSEVGNHALAAMLQTFRVQHLVGVGQDDVTQMKQLFEDSTNHTFNLKQYGEVEHIGDARGQQMTLAEAVKLAGHPIKTLPNDPQKNYVDYVGAQDVVFRLKVDPINSLLHRLGGKTEFPSSVDGKPIIFHIPPVIHQNMNLKLNQNMSLEQLQAPSLDVPQGVDVDQVRKALLDLPFLPDTVRSQLLRSEDWKNTLFLPVGRGNAQNIFLNGHEAILNSDPHYHTLMWLQDGVIYTLSGSETAFPSDQSIIDVAKEIAQ